LGKPADRHKAEITAMAFGREGGSLYTASLDGSVRKWDVPNRSLSNVLNPPGGSRAALTSLVVSPDGMVAASAGPRILVWPAGSVTASVLSSPGAQPISALALDPAAHTVFGASGNRVLRWPLNSVQPAARCLPACNQSLDGGVAAVAADSHQFVYAASGSKIYWWHVSDATADNSGAFDPKQPSLLALTIVGSGATELQATEDATSIKLWRAQ
jgi:hypothetical protein